MACDINYARPAPAREASAAAAAAPAEVEEEPSPADDDGAAATVAGDVAAAAVAVDYFSFLFRGEDLARPAWTTAGSPPLLAECCDSGFRFLHNTKLHQHRHQPSTASTKQKLATCANKEANNIYVLTSPQLPSPPTTSALSTQVFPIAPFQITASQSLISSQMIQSLIPSEMAPPQSNH